MSPGTKQVRIVPPVASNRITAADSSLLLIQCSLLSALNHKLGPSLTLTSAKKESVKCGKEALFRPMLSGMRVTAIRFFNEGEFSSEDSMSTWEFMEKKQRRA